MIKFIETNKVYLSKDCKFVKVYEIYINEELIAYYADNKIIKIFAS